MLMLGKSREALRLGTTGFATRVAAPVPARTDAPLLRASTIASGPRLRGVTFEVHRGEIVGLAGLLGSGRTETARAVFGATLSDSGTMLLDGAMFAPRTPRDAILAGIGFVPEDRKADGLFPDLSVRENVTLAALPLLTSYGVVSRRRQAEVVQRYLQRMGIKATGADQKARELSGGNQQKVILARWLCNRAAPAAARRTDARHRHRRQRRDPTPDQRPRRLWFGRADDLFRARGAR